jgi:hypothetical protein
VTREETPGIEALGCDGVLMTDAADLLRLCAEECVGEESYRTANCGAWSPRKWLVLVWLDQDTELIELIDGIRSPLRDYATALHSTDRLERELAAHPAGGPWPSRLTADITLHWASLAGLAHLDCSVDPPRATVTATGRLVVSRARAALDG